MLNYVNRCFLVIEHDPLRDPPPVYHDHEDPCSRSMYEEAGIERMIDLRNYRRRDANAAADGAAGRRLLDGARTTSSSSS
jgi:hypothetical protein